MVKIYNVWNTAEGNLLFFKINSYIMYKMIHDRASDDTGEECFDKINNVFIVCNKNRGQSEKIKNQSS